MRNLYNSSHENKKALSPFYLKKNLIENEYRTPIGCLTCIFFQKKISDKIDLRLFYFHVTIYPRISNIEHVLSDISNGHIYQISGTQGWKPRKKNK